MQPRTLSLLNFIVNLDGPTEELLVNEIGSTSGVAAVPTEFGDYVFDIDADGPWSITVGQPFAPPEEVRTVPNEASGQGPAVVGPLEIEDQVTVSGEHCGESNFIVNAYDEGDSGTFDGELIFNDIGEVDDATLVDYPGIIWFDIEADGEWSLSIE